jgi:hypothetical protein
LHHGQNLSANDFKEGILSILNPAHHKPAQRFHLQEHGDRLMLRLEDFRLKERIAIRLSRAVPATPIRADSYREEAFAASRKKTVSDSTKGYDEDLLLILP